MIRLENLELYSAAAPDTKLESHGFQYLPAAGQLACNICVIGVILTLGDAMGVRPLRDFDDLEAEHDAGVWQSWIRIVSNAASGSKSSKYPFLDFDPAPGRPCIDALCRTIYGS